ncbi:hypothetical protein DFH08DRAFT_882528 [Mycena albidolilacea]|uniref:Uncharacterized protein n=1 Tax=Mycena albidolilacea TaxID=1033008 RepID=A0AAD7EJV0_9AGAR|nr:hypothetical protein DFH08DRAFT_882528 [Mycena albidolilacea]
MHRPACCVRTPASVCSPKMLHFLYCFLGSFLVLITASPHRVQRSTPASWSSSVYQELFVSNKNYSTTFSLVNSTCHLLCDAAHQTFKNCTTSSPDISACLCTDIIGGELELCVSCIAAVADSKLLNFTAKLGLRHWYLDCKLDGHNVSQPQVNATLGLALATMVNAEYGISLRAAGIVATALVFITMCAV